MRLTVMVDNLILESEVFGYDQDQFPELCRINDDKRRRTRASRHREAYQPVSLPRQIQRPRRVSCLRQFDPQERHRWLFLNHASI